MKRAYPYIRYMLVLFAALLCLSSAAQDTKVQEAKKAKRKAKGKKMDLEDMM